MMGSRFKNGVQLVIRTAIGCAWIGFGADSASATIGTWTGNISAFEQNSSNRGGTPDESSFSFVRFVGSYSATACSANIGYFNGKNDPILVAVALSALTSGRVVTIVVDDTFVKYGSVCQVIDIKISN